jgi:hypothetical protein
MDEPRVQQVHGAVRIRVVGKQTPAERKRAHIVCEQSERHCILGRRLHQRQRRGSVGGHRRAQQQSDIDAAICSGSRLRGGAPCSAVGGGLNGQRVRHIREEESCIDSGRGAGLVDDAVERLSGDHGIRLRPYRRQRGAPFARVEVRRAESEVEAGLGHA